ncbi:nitroreductase/quinone reductase family protein [Saccharothrix carnea]|uniref:nitroreductase/quinone reductase family protein n=1 Tax=Saccharothrix carnea TaxID=1280637 RepID=UPI001C62FD71
MVFCSVPLFRASRCEYPDPGRIERLPTRRVVVAPPRTHPAGYRDHPRRRDARRIIDITTRGRRTGRPRRIEIFFYRAAGRTYLCSGAGGAATDWHANLLANPDFTFHLKNGVRVDLAARATPVTDPAERQAVLAEIVADLNQPHDPGTIRPTRLEDWMDSRLMRVTFPQP